MTTRNRMAVALALMATAGAAAAEKPAPPGEHVRRVVNRRVQQANKLYDQGRYEEAVRLYQSAADLMPPSGTVLYNLGLARYKIGDYAGCVRAMAQYIRENPNASDLDLAVGHRENCRQQARISVSVSSYPLGAAITIDDGAGAVARGRTPATLVLAPGSYRLAFDLPGHATSEQDVVVDVDSQTTVDVTLEKLGELEVTADVAGATARIGSGDPQPLPLRASLRGGAYRIQVEREGYATVARDVLLDPGQRRAIEVSLTRLPVLGRLAIDSHAAGATVTIDGARAGAAPVERQVTAGTRRVAVRAPGRIPYEADIDVPPDDTLRLRVHLARGRSRGQRYVLWGLVVAAGVSALSGAVFTGIVLADQSEFAGMPTPDLRDQGLSHARTADICWGLAAGSAISALIYYVATSPAASYADRAE